MTSQLLATYRRFRSVGSGLVGRDAECALRSARTLLAFRELESRDLVRMLCEPESGNYFDCCGSEENPRDQKAMEDIIERLGVWRTASEYFDGREWQHADSCGMHAGYVNPLCPFENCYVIDEMAVAVREAEAALYEQEAERENALDAACRDIVTV